MGNSLIDPENQLATPDVKVRIFTHLTRPPSDNLLNQYAGLYMSGFNQAPWDVYEYKYTVAKARKEFNQLVSAALDSGGALISLMYRRRPVGFSIVHGLDLFIRELKKIEGRKRLPSNFKNPGPYFEALSQLLKVPLGEFETIGSIADIVVDERYRGKGYGNKLTISSLKFLKEDGKKYALAWTVNPVMANILSEIDFKRIYGIGDQGEGIDFTVHAGAWYPTLVLPAKRKVIQSGGPIAAQHYLFTFSPPRL